MSRLVEINSEKLIPAEDSLDEIHSLARELLRVTISICERHDIPYYLVEGTLLGAVRHKGFIPWDDDVDIAIPIDYFSKFLYHAKDELLSDIYSLNRSFSKEARECPDTTRIHRNDFEIITTSGHIMGVWIDIINLVGMPSNRLKRNFYYAYIFFRRIMVRVSNPDIIMVNYWLNQKPFRRLIINLVKRFNIGRFFSYERQIQKLKKCLKKYPVNKSKFVMTYPSAYGKKEIFPRKFYGNGIEEEFQGLRVRLPDQPHKILTSLYGDYMQLPPKEKRIPSHAQSDERRVTCKDCLDERQSQIKNIQTVLKEMLREVISVCDHNNITYYVVEGTLLGTVRHKGFIPWDDDVDIAVPVERLDDFARCCEMELPDYLYVEPAFSKSRVSAICPDIVRICSKMHQITDISMNVTNLWIDVIPIIDMPSNILGQKLYFSELMIRKIMVRISRPEIIGRYYWRNQSIWRRIIIKIVHKIDFSKIFLYENQLRKMKKSTMRYLGQKSRYVVLFPSAYGKKEIVPKSYYGNGIKGQFENIEVRMPVRYKEILTNLYGADYMTLPPKEKRVGSHINIKN